MKQLSGVFKIAVVFIWSANLGFANVPDLESECRFLKLNGTISYVAAQDFNGDGRVDLLAVTESADSFKRRKISIFFNDDTIHEVPNLVFIPAVNDVFFTIENMENSGGKNLILLGTAGLSMFALNDKISSAHKKVFTISTLIPPDKTDLLKYDFAADIDGDSIPEIFVPSINRIKIFKKEGDDNYGLYKTLITEPEISVLKNEILTYQFSIPEIKIGNMGGDNKADIVLKYNDKIEIFHTGRFFDPSNNNISIKPDTTISFKLIDPSIRGTENIRERHSLYLIDLNNDGLFDVVHKVIVKTSSPESMIEMYVYLNKGGAFSDDPDNVFVSESFGGESAIRDFNNDGIMDFALFKIPLGIAQIPAYIFKKKLSAGFDFYIMKPSGRYSDKPESSAGFGINVLPEDIPAYRLCFSFEGDFNTDGYKDLVAETGEGKFSIYLNGGNGKFHFSSDYSFKASQCRNILIFDADNDGADDIILWDKNHIEIVPNPGRDNH